MHLTDQPETRAGDQPEVRFTLAAPAGQPDSPSTDAGELGENVEFF
jgi:hypothetical protein